MSTLAVEQPLAAPLSGAGATASAAASTCSLLRMAVAEEIVAVGIEDVREILQMTRLTPLPRTPDFVRGVMNLRGAVVPVVDLAARLGRAPTVLGRRACIIVVECAAADDDDGAEGAEDADDDRPAAALVMGLLVDAVFEVFDRNTDEIEPAPALGTRIAPEFLRGITRADGQLIGVLALPRLLAVRELALAIAEHQPR